NSLGFMVVHHGKIVTENYFNGWNNQLAGDSESMAKSVLSLLIGIAIDEGKISSINDSASKYITEWKNDDRRRIKIKHLIQMTSGLRNSSSTISPFSDLAKIHLGFNVKDLALSIPSEISPGRVFDYNNVNSEILGILLERATSMKYSDYLSEKLWKPLGASDAEVSVDNTGTARTYCCLFAKMVDWSKVGELILHNGEFNGKRVVSKDWIAKMITPSRNANHYGYHVWLANSKLFRKARMTENFVDESMIFFDGRSKQRVFILPKWDLVIVRVGDTSDTWKENIVPNILVRDLQKNLNH
ncbi:MAG: serine hydrolase, partial [Candidatus Sericytochromatia bacterium]|nr:serine hydrolase [Candidatus Sericytochromatia bacterium]